MSEAELATARDLTFHGINARHHGQAEQAESLLRRATDACPQDHRIRQHFASALVDQGKIDEAIDQLTLAIEQPCHDPELYVDLGNLYLLKQQPARALASATEALRINRQSPEAWILRGKCLRQQNDLNGALASFHRAAGMNHVSCQVQLEIAAVYRQMQKPMQALTALDLYHQNFDRDDVPMPAVRLMASTLMELRQHERAREYLARATQRDDATPEVWLALSRVQSITGDPSRALGTAQNAQALFPEHHGLNQWIGSLERQHSAVAGTRTAALPN